MLIAAALLELALPESDSLKEKRRVIRSVKDRLRSRFNLSVAEVADHDDHHAICLGLVGVGTDPRYLREQLSKALRFVESLGLAEVVGDDIVVARLDELESAAPDEEEAESATAELPGAWREE